MRGLLAVVLLTACGSSPKPPAAPAPAPAPAPVEEDKPDEAEAKTAGILGAGPVEEGGAFASLTGTGDISSGFDDANIYGGLLGNEEDSWWSDGESSGGFGYGRSGFGPGQGGTGWGTIGTGRYGSIGHGSGTGSGYGVAPPEVRLGAFTAVGDLDKAIIRRYIKRNFAKIRYCYEKELIAKPKLAGAVSMSFTIGGNGVTTVQKSTSANKDLATVAQCVEAVIRAIQFPQPKNGGSVTVDFPFTFAPATP